MKKVLIVEDDSFVSRMYERAFKLGGYDVEVMTDGQAALAYLGTTDPLPSIIMMDVMMPKMGGFELLKAVKADLRFAHIPIAVLTNSYLQTTATQFLSMGADLYLVKIEHSSKDIVQKMDELIEKYAILTNKK